MKWLLADWGKSKRERFDAVARGLHRLGHGVVRISRHGMATRPHLLEAIRSGEFDALVTWQRFFGMQRDIRAALSESGIRTLYMDFGFVPHYRTSVFDSEGENATSSWPAMWKSGHLPDVDPEFMEAAERLVSEAASGSEEPPEEIAGCVQRPFIFVPLQRTGDTVVRYDSKVRDFGMLVQRVLSLADGRFVVIKTHPLDRELNLGVPDLVPGRHVVLRSGFGESNEAACEWLLKNAELVVGVNSNMLFRALCFGARVVATGRGWYSGAGVLHEVDGVEGLENLAVPPPDMQARTRYIAFCLSRQLLFSELSDPKKLGPLLARILPRRPGEPKTSHRRKTGMWHIPRVFHQIWFGGDVPNELVRVQRRMLELHPGWDHRLWTAQTMPALLNENEFNEASDPKFKADIARYELLARFGGVYVDLDYLFLRSIEPLLDSSDHLLTWAYMGLINNGIMAFAKNHPLAWALVRELPASYRLFRDTSGHLQCGSQFVTRIVEERFPQARIVPPQLFCSVQPGELDNGSVKPHPAAVAVHLWNHRYARGDGRRRPAIDELLKQV